MRNDQKINSWLDTVVSGIRFGLDREEVRQELEAHIEDKMLDLQRIFPGIAEEEAQERALTGMGDPEELKVSLAKVHRPWLGYLWEISWVAVLCALILSVISFHDIWWDVKEDYQRRQYYEQSCEALYGSDPEAREGERLAVYAPNAEARLGRATITVPRATRWQWSSGRFPLYLQVRITWDHPWDVADGDELLWYFRVNGEECLYAFNAKGWNWCEMNLWVEEDKMPEAEQVVLTYLPVTDFALTVDLSREVEP